MVDGLEQRVRRLEDIEAIRQLKHRYCRVTDWGWDKPPVDDVTFHDLFVEDGTWQDDFTLQGEWLPDPDRVVQPHRIDLASLGAATQGSAKGAVCAFGMHYVANEVIDIDGDEATGYWHTLCPMTLEAPDGSTSEAVWLTGMYVETYRRTPVGWKYVSIKVVTAFCTPVLKGWVGSPFPSLAATAP